MTRYQEWKRVIFYLYMHTVWYDSRLYFPSQSAHWADHTRWIFILCQCKNQNLSINIKEPLASIQFAHFILILSYLFVLKACILKINQGILKNVVYDGLGLCRRLSNQFSFITMSLAFLTYTVSFYFKIFLNVICNITHMPGQCSLKNCINTPRTFHDIH